MAITEDIAGAEDVCQDAFIFLIEHIDDVAQPDKVSSWLFQVVRNRARNYLRALNSDRTISVDLNLIPSDTPSPSLNAERSEVRSQLIAALSGLPADRREIILLHDVEGWTHLEIAKLLGVPAGTVRSHLHYARRAMRELLEELKGTPK